MQTVVTVDYYHLSDVDENDDGAAL